MDPRVTEFQCIMPVENIPSVLQRGIFSHEKASKIIHASVAMDSIQEKRNVKHVPGGLKLHQYANLYFHARNPMLYKRKDHIANLCVLRVSTTLRELPDVVFSDMNAASEYVRFLSPAQTQYMDFDSIYAMDWRHPDPIQLFKRYCQLN